MKTVEQLETENAALRLQVEDLKQKLTKAFEAMQKQHDEKTQLPRKIS